MKAVPIYLLTGFLGAGKTTTLNHLLLLDFFREKKLVVIINEFGSIGIDGLRVKKSEVIHKLYEINRGSLFCTCTEKDFIKTLIEIKDRVHPEAILIEATGIIETGDITQFIVNSSLTDFFEIRCNICLVDAVGFIKVLPMVKSARSQVAFADALVINKCDLINDKELIVLEQVINSINSSAPVSKTVKGKIEAAFINSIEHSEKEKMLLEKPPENIYSVSFRNSAEIDRDTFIKVITKMGENLLRLKGYVRFSTGVNFVEVINGELVNEEPSSENKNSAFVAIGWKLEKEKMRELFEGMV